MSQAMIISLGGTPEPLVRSIAKHRPQFVSFLASQESVVVLGKVKELLEAQDHPFPDHRVVLVENVNDLVHCYERALECARFLEAREIAADEVVVDYTGGTKNMTAALTLATVRKGYRFSYVGGEARTKGNLGIVKDGFEVVHTGVSPWQIFAVEEWQHLVLYVQQYHYEAALTLVQETRRRQPPAEQMLWEGLENALEGMRQWDRFNHRDALPRFKEGLRGLQQWVEVKGNAALVGFVQEGQRCRDFLIQLASTTNNFKRLDRLLVVDLLANAERRADQGRYDDAMARLYRALEMLGQIALKDQTGASTSNVLEQTLPEHLREEFSRKYRDSEDKKIKLPLEATFRVLQALKNSVGCQFFERYEAYRKILYARNLSILAHGIQPVDQDAFTSFRDLVRDSFDIREEVTFPRLRFPY
jgi:CRISPR-associated protein (TIGR02710 family)